MVKVRSAWRGLLLAFVGFGSQSALCRAAFAEPARLAVRGPSQAHLAETTYVELEVTGAAEDAWNTLAWRTNVGRVDPMAVGVLRYTPASKQFPQVALVAAYDPEQKEPVVHFVRLIGSPTIEVKSEPNVAVTVQIADTSFGPQRTDNAGIALVPVHVPPGIETATTVATDAHGNVTRDELALNPPPFPRLLTLCANAEPAVYVVEVDNDGRPATEPSFRLAVPSAVSESPALVQPGVFRVGLRPDDTLKEPLRVEARASVDSFSDSCSLDLVPPPVAEPYTFDGQVIPRERAYSWSLGATAGWLTNTHRVSGPWASVRGAYHWDDGHAGFRFELEAGVSQTNAIVLTTDGQELALDIRTIPIFANARYVFDWGIVHPMAAISVGAAMSRAQAKGSNVLTDEALTTPWLAGSVGAMWWLGRHELAAEVGYAIAKNSTGSVIGNLGGLKLTLGYQYAI